MSEWQDAVTFCLHILFTFCLGFTYDIHQGCNSRFRRIFRHTLKMTIMQNTHNSFWEIIDSENSGHFLEGILKFWDFSGFFPGKSEGWILILLNYYLRIENNFGFSESSPLRKIQNIFPRRPILPKLDRIARSKFFPHSNFLRISRRLSISGIFLWFPGRRYLGTVPIHSSLSRRDIEIRNHKGRLQYCFLYSG